MGGPTSVGNILDKSRPPKHRGSDKVSVVEVTGKVKEQEGGKVSCLDGKGR